VGVVQGEERFDGRVEPHPHLVCFRCGRIVDIGGDWSETLRSFPDSEGTELESGFSIDHRRTVFYGLCGDCRETVDDGANTAGP
jgi:Fur family peroxide stress response transcriptional regulator